MSWLAIPRPLSNTSREIRSTPWTNHKDYLKANADYATDLATMIGDFVDYGRVKQRLERLATKLEVPPVK